MPDMTITVCKKFAYGDYVYEPMCPASKAMAKLRKSKNLTKKDLEILEGGNFKIIHEIREDR
jgi:hypothetical protein